MPMCCGQFFEVNWTLQYQCFLGHGQRQFSKSQNFNHGVCLKDIPMKSGMLVAQKQWNQQAKFQGNILNSYRFIATWSVQQLLASLCRQPAPVCPAIDEIRYNSTGNPLTKWKIRNASKSSKCVWKYKGEYRIPKMKFKHFSRTFQALEW